MNIVKVGEERNFLETVAGWRTLINILVHDIKNGQCVSGDWGSDFFRILIVSDMLVMGTVPVS